MQKYNHLHKEKVNRHNLRPRSHLEESRVQKQTETHAVYLL